MRWRGLQSEIASGLDHDATTVRPSDAYLLPGKAMAPQPFGYGYLLWLLPGQRRQFAMVGAFGQRVIVDPGSEMVMVQTALRPFPRSGAYGRRWLSSSGRRNASSVAVLRSPDAAQRAALAALCAQSLTSSDYFEAELDRPVCRQGGREPPQPATTRGLGEGGNDPRVLTLGPVTPKVGLRSERFPPEYAVSGDSRGLHNPEREFLCPPAIRWIQ